MKEKLLDKNIKWTNVIRRAIQALSFIIMPGLFISVFSAVKSLYISLISGSFDFGSQISNVILLVAVLPLTVILGRFFCGFLCSFGTLGDFVWFVAGKIRKKRIKIGERADRVLKYFKYAWLVFLVLFVWTLGAVTFDARLSPWNVFGMYTSLAGWQSLAGLLSVGGLLLLVIIVGSALIERFFCRYMCPLGAFFGIISKIRILKIKKPTEECRSCKACTKNCVMGIDLYKHDTVNSGECINCFECISVCPRENSQLSFLGEKVKPALTAVLVCLIIGGVYFANKIVPQEAYAAPAETEIAAVADAQEDGTAAESCPYIDGIYTGRAMGYRGMTTVEVTVEDGYITCINVVSTGDDSEFFLPAQRSVVSDIIYLQTTDVDVVSGATYSSYAIIDAVDNALEGHMMPHIPMMHADDTARTAEPTATATATATPEAITASDLETIEANPEFADLADGVYTGSGTGYNGQTIVEVTVADGKITAITVVSYVDDRPYFEYAVTIIDDVIAAQSLEVDTVSGATYSANSILEAVADALSIGYTPEETSGGQRRRGGGGEH